MFSRMTSLFATVWLFAFAPGFLFGQTTPQVVDHPLKLIPASQDVRYGIHPRNLLDFFPAESDTPTPVLIYFHGGGFVAGDKEDDLQRPVIRDFLGNGISIVSANYRFVTGPDSEPFPGSLLDGVRVVQFVRSQAKLWNLDPERIVLSGGSAGALMSLWIALHDDFAISKSDDLLARQSSRVLGVVAYWGPTTLDPHVIVEHVGGNPDIHPSIFPIYNIKKIKELDLPAMRKKVVEFSPLSHVSVDDPPLHLRYNGTALSDTPLPADTSFDISIHHAKFGDLMRGKYEEVGSLQTVELVCTDCSYAGATELDFLRGVFGLRDPKEKSSAE